MSYVKVQKRNKHEFFYFPVHIDMVDEYGQGGMKMFSDTPGWVFLMMLLIFLSGYMAFRAMQSDKQSEKRLIEQEGEIYMDRMEREKERRSFGEKQMHKF